MSHVDVMRAIQGVLDETLSLGGRGYQLNPESPLFGAISELDSQAIVHVLVALEEEFDIIFDDDEIDASVFESVGNLQELVLAKLNSREST